MEDKSKKKSLEEYYQQRSGFSIFDFYKKPGWRLGTGDELKGPYWYVAVTFSVGIGLWAVWDDILGDAGPARIGVIWIFVSGISYYFLVRLQQTLLWGAVGAAGGAILTAALQVRHWFTNDVWPGWTMRDISMFSEIVGVSENSLIVFIGEQSAILALLVLAVIAAFAALVAQRFKST